MRRKRRRIAAASGNGVGGYRDFSALYRAHLDAVYRHAFARLGTREEAEDVTAAVFEEALRRAQLHREPAEIAVWLRRVADGTIARHWRERYRLPVVPLRPWHDREEAPAVNEADEEARRAALLSILTRLQQNYRQVLQLRFVEGRSLRETARCLGTTEGNVKVLQYRALRKALEVGQS